MVGSEQVSDDFKINDKALSCDDGGGGDISTTIPSGTSAVGEISLASILKWHIWSES
jgi:hypothetical protein